jgi:hypothetical protein
MEPSSWLTIDYLIVDRCDNFKNILYRTKTREDM